MVLLLIFLKFVSSLWRLRNVATHWELLLILIFDVVEILLCIVLGAKFWRIGSLQFSILLILHGLHCFCLVMFSCNWLGFCLFDLCPKKKINVLKTCLGVILILFTPLLLYSKLLCNDVINNSNLL